MFLVNGINMSNQDKTVEIIKNLKDSSNSELKFALATLSSDFESVKSQLVNLTKDLDNIEKLYNKVLTEYKKRNLV